MATREEMLEELEKAKDKIEAYKGLSDSTPIKRLNEARFTLLWEALNDPENYELSAHMAEIEIGDHYKPLINRYRPSRIVETDATKSKSTPKDIKTTAKSSEILDEDTTPAGTEEENQPEARSSSTPAEGYSTAWAETAREDIEGMNEPRLKKLRGRMFDNRILSFTPVIDPDTDYLSPVYYTIENASKYIWNEKFKEKFSSNKLLKTLDRFENHLDRWKNGRVDYPGPARVTSCVCISNAAKLLSCHAGLMSPSDNAMERYITSTELIRALEETTDLGDCVKFYPGSVAGEYCFDTSDKVNLQQVNTYRCHVQGSSILLNLIFLFKNSDDIILNIAEKRKENRKLRIGMAPDFLMDADGGCILEMSKMRKRLKDIINVVTGNHIKVDKYKKSNSSEV